MLNTVDNLQQKLRISGIVDESFVDGPGIRMAIFTQGCHHNCKGCHNPESHSVNGGVEISLAELLNKMDNNVIIDGVTFSGGEPFLQSDKLAILAAEVKKRNLHLIVYTGFLYEKLLEMAKSNENIQKLLSLSDWIVDGPYVEELANRELDFRGSSNQRIIKLNE